LFISCFSLDPISRFCFPLYTKKRKENTNETRETTGRKRKIHGKEARGKKPQEETERKRKKTYEANERNHKKTLEETKESTRKRRRPQEETKEKHKKKTKERKRKKMY
jgi:hypothetical protein